MNGKPVIYFSGNSLGLQPKNVQETIALELERWKSLGVDGHFQGSPNWKDFHLQFQKPLSILCGANQNEVVAMNSLTVNLHLMLSSFYSTENGKGKILIEEELFGSDYYALESHVKKAGLNPDETIVKVSPEPDGHYDLEKIDAILDQDDFQMLYWSGVNFLTGEAYDLETLGRICRKHGILFGLDLAHAIGNVQLSLSEWDVDFAVWCSYKYLNSGPGSVGGAFINQKHHTYERLQGWWGSDDSRRFDMAHEFIPAPGADGWQLSNAPVLSMAAHKAALDIFMEDENLTDRLNRGKVLARQLKDNISDLPFIKVLTPENHGSQISVESTKSLEALQESGFIFDQRLRGKATIARIAPNSFYNEEAEIEQLVQSMLTLA